MTATWHEQMAGDRTQLDGEARSAWRQLLGCLVALGVLAAALPRPGALITTVLTGSTSGAAGAGAGEIAPPDVAAGGTRPAFGDTAQSAVLLTAGLIVWVLLIWGLAIVVIAAAGRLPGASGRTARRLLRRIAPAAASRLVIAAVGVTAIAGAGGCAVPDSTGAANVSSVNGASTADPTASADPTAPLFDIDWPDPLGGTPSSATPSTAAPSTAAPSTAAPTPAAAVQGPPSSSTAPTSAPTTDTTAANPATAEIAGPATPGEPTPAAGPADTAAPDTPATQTPVSDTSAADTSSTADPAGPRDQPATSAPPAADATTGAQPGASTTASDGSVIVQPGDTLWGIAARHLPAQATAAEIDTAWRAWYSANTELIGADPDLIIPGQRLLPGDTETRR